MDRLTKIARLSLALAAALALSAMFSGAAGAMSARALGGSAPRLSLSVPAEVTKAVPAVAKGRVVPAQGGRVLLRAWRGHAWRPVAAGKVRNGRFRISFVLRGPVPSAARLRATLVQGRRWVASSAAHRVRLRRAQTAPAPVGAPAPASAPAVAPAEAVDPVPGEAAGDMYWGAWIGSQLTGTAAPWDMGAASKFEQLAGKPLSMLQFSSPFANCSKSPCSYYPFPVESFDAIRSHGAIPFFSWSSQAIPALGDQSAFQLSDILAGTYDSYIGTWAARAAEWGHPFFLRFDWEMNGSWFPWGENTNGNQTGELAAAWRHVHDIFTAAGATNATWVWCPYVNQGDDFARLYPGDSYVDWTCLDGYNWGLNPAAPHGWNSFDGIYERAYETIAGTLAPSKPMVVAEAASSEYGGSKAAWIADMFDALATRYPQVRGLLWFETVDQGMDWPIESSESATAAFAAGIGDSRYLGNVFGALDARPIPAP
jgi:Glycosyl hydrolase family 26